MIPFSMDSSEDARGVTLVRLSGRLSAASAHEAKERLKGLVSSGAARLVLDLQDLSFIDSSGLSALVAAYKAAVESGGGLKLCRLSPQVAKVFTLTNLVKVFEIHPDTEAALRSFAP